LENDVAMNHGASAQRSTNDNGSHPENQRAQIVTRQTRAEYDVLLGAIHRLEAALASAAPGREQTWNDRVARDLASVQKALEEHVTSAESADGLFSEIDLTRPTLIRTVERLRGEHVDLLHQTEALRCQLAHRGPGEPARFSDVRQQAARLLEALRHHQAREVDVIFESFFTDIGAGD
jgi:ribosomal protein L29